MKDLHKMETVMGKFQNQKLIVITGILHLYFLYTFTPTDISRKWKDFWITVFHLFTQ